MLEESTEQDREDKRRKEQIKNKAELERRERELNELFEIMKHVTPGKKLRDAIDNIAKGGVGALIVLGDTPKVLKIINGGFKIDCKFTPQKLVELCKMDGAIILSDDLKRIVYCNTLLVPDPSISTNETGTRHKAAERATKQTSKPVIAVSERRKTISLYYKNTRYTIRNTEEILNKAVETLRMLEKHKETLKELLFDLDVLEFANLATLQDVVLCIQRIEIMDKISETIKRYLIELGSEGNLVSILFKEVIKNLNKEREFLIKDYSRSSEFTTTALPTLDIDELIEPANIVRLLLYSNISDSVVPKGYRLLSKISISKESKESLIEHFKNIQELFDAVENQTDKLKGTIGEKDTNKLIKELNNLKEQALVEKKF